MERMIVAFDRQTVAQKISESLKLGGFHIAAVCGSCAEVLRWSDQRQVLVICGFKLPDGPCASLAELLPPQVPVLMVASAANLELVTDARIAKLAMPVSRRDFIGAVAALLEKNRRTDRRPPAHGAAGGVDPAGESAFDGRRGAFRAAGTHLAAAAEHAAWGADLSDGGPAAAGSAAVVRAGRKPERSSVRDEKA